jgi:hypothetical protein
MRTVTLRYYSYRLLCTLDFNRLLERLISEVPDLSRVVIEGMAEDEKRIAAPTDKHGIVMVMERIHVYVSADGGDEERRRDLEIEAELR